MAATASSLSSSLPKPYHNTLTLPSSLFSKTLTNPSFSLTPNTRLSLSLLAKNPISYIIFAQRSNPDEHLLPFDSFDDKPLEECGVVGIYGTPRPRRRIWTSLGGGGVGRAVWLEAALGLEISPPPLAAMVGRRMKKDEATSSGFVHKE